MPDEIFDDHYASHYAALYIDHPSWEPKLQHNRALLGALLKPLGNWLDTCCGQGWHLAQFPHHRRMGIDRSAAQLDRARLLNPGVPFIEADVVEYEFPDGQRFDLVSNFWFSYSYLNDEDAIRVLVQKLVRWTAPGGALYLELAVPEMLKYFNESEFAAETGARVVLKSPDAVRWEFHDSGGVHRVMSPRLEFFSDLIRPHFEDVSDSTVVRAVRQLVARNRRAD
ncbi:MAG: class I SAM-dependent methyltransferase [bacterium]|nr:class I SAM-dependent methyltransferase [bacterium]